MAATMKFVTLHANYTAQAGVVRATSPSKTRQGTKSAARPHQRGVEVNDLTQQEWDELAGLLEAEFARQ